jgi:transposase
VSYIAEVKVGKHTYLYECTAYRDQNGKARSTRTTVGKIDPKTGNRMFKPEYIERMRTGGTPIDIPSTAKLYSAQDIKNSRLREYGLFYLLRGISQRYGLIEALQESLPEYWQEVFMLACHLVANGDSFMHCEEWLSQTESFSVGSMSSQRISELTASIIPDMREAFYKAWCSRRAEEEYLAVDITSTSSYSEFIEDVEWGYNRDGEALPQINICMLMGESSRLPIYQMVYAGSLKDASTLSATLAMFNGITGGKPVLLVMDKGFYSKRNVNRMLNTNSNTRFIIPVPFTANFAKRQVTGERKDIDTIHNTINLGGETLRTVSKIRAWDKDVSLFTHIFYSPAKAFRRREDIFAHVSTLRDEAMKNPEKWVEEKDHAKYLYIRKSSSAASGYTVSVREDVLEEAIGTSGWLVIISNDIKDPKEALRIYRAKDVVEKGFLRLKCDLDLGRLRVHSQERMQNKVFIGFVALVLRSAVHNVMSDKELYKKMTMNQLLRTLSKLRVQEIGKEQIVFPATKMQKEIFKAFGLEEPVSL